MRIAQYLYRYRLEDGGVVRAVLDLCGALSQRGHEITMLTFDAADVPTSQRDGDSAAAIEPLEQAAGVFSRLSRGSAAHVRRRLGDVDVLHLHVPWDPICLHLAKLARRAGVPYVLSLHGMLDDFCMDQKSLKKRAYLRLVGRRLLERAHAVHCTAEAERAESSKWYRRGRSVVVPLVFDLDPFRELPGPEVARRRFPAASEDRPVVLFVGRLHPMKRLELLIDAAARLRDEGLEFGVLIAGSGEAAYEAGLRKRVREHGLSDVVEFLGFVAGREKVSLYEAADVVVLPSHHENWGFALVEAMACGTPVIVTRAVIIWEELEASGAALVAEPTPESLASALSRMLRDEAGLREMSGKARAWVLDALAVDRVAAQYESLYQGALAESGAQVGA